VQDVIAGLRRVVNEFDDRVLIGEIYLPIERLVAYYGANLDGVHLPFNFQLVRCPWNARGIARLIDQYERALPHGGWPNWVLGNHDNPRIATRIGAAQARVAAMMLLTLRGTPTMYYGEELGMHNVPIPPERVQDPFEKNVPGLGLGRDPERTPMQWSAGPHTGFSEAEPWLPIADDYACRCVEAERDDPRSMLTLYRRLLELRRRAPALNIGDYRAAPAQGDVLAYRRVEGDSQFLIALNLGGGDAVFSGMMPAGHVVLSTHLDREGEAFNGRIELRPADGVVVRLEG
jgi:alpha-glucosidase